MYSNFPSGLQGFSKLESFRLCWRPHNMRISRMGATWRSKLPLGPVSEPAGARKCRSGSASESPERSKWPFEPASEPAERSKWPFEPTSEPPVRSKVLFEPALRPQRRSKTRSKLRSKTLFKDSVLCDTALCGTALCSALLRAWICTGSH